MGPGVTTTTVSLFFALEVGFAQDKLAEMYEPAIRAAGWNAQPLDLAPVHSSGDRQAGLYYCKDLNGVPSFLSVYERWVALPTVGFLRSPLRRKDTGLRPGAWRSPSPPCAVAAVRPSERSRGGRFGPSQTE
ncbi:hypothetical protein [Micromonospora cremea]|uniref:hypothetical protein n=1 Tax=Micromonospora cremea TaxID=709881 RepID=UPI00117C9508|nr:hypothetical protein [Micromonospora cremea]